MSSPWLKRVIFISYFITQLAHIIFRQVFAFFNRLDASVDIHFSSKKKNNQDVTKRKKENKLGWREPFFFMLSKKKTELNLVIVLIFFLAFSTYHPFFFQKKKKKIKMSSEINCIALIGKQVRIV